MNARNHSKGGWLLRDIAYGVVGGAIGTVVMGEVTNFLYRFESKDKKKKEEELRREPPYEVMAERLAKNVFGTDLSKQTKSKFGQVAHWGYGLAWGGIYGAMRNGVPSLSRAAGLPFGIAFWAIGDEALNAALKLTPPPQAFPMDAHVRGLVGHLMYTATADGVCRILQRVVG